MKKNLLGKVIGEQLVQKNKLFSIVIPLGVDKDLPKYIVEGANELAEKEGFSKDKPFAVQVVPRNEPSKLPKVSELEVIAYRTDSRLFVWEQDVFPPDSSFKSTVENVIDFSFPSEESDLFTLEILAKKTRDTLKKLYPENLSPGEWNTFDAKLVDIFRFLKDAYQKFGNDNTTWFASWWNSVDLFLDELERLLQRSGVRLNLNQELFGAAGLPIPDNGSNYKKLKPDNYAKIIEEHFKTLEQTTLTISRYPENVGIKSLPWEKYGRFLLNKNHPIRALTSLTDDNQPDDRIEAWGLTTESDFIDSLNISQEKGLVEINIDEKSLPGRPESNPNLYVLPLSLGELDKDNGNFWTLTFRSVEFKVPLKKEINPNSYSSSISHISFKPEGSLQFEPDSESPRLTKNHLIFSGDLSFSIKKKGSWISKPIEIIVGVNGGNLLGEGLISGLSTCKVMIPALCQYTLFVINSRGTPKIHLPKGKKYTLDNGEIIFTGSDSDLIYPIKNEDRADIVGYDGRETMPPKAFKVDDPLKVATAFDEDSPDELFLMEQVYLADEMELLSEDLLLKISSKEKKDRPWLPIAATALNVPPCGDNPKQEMKSELRGVLEKLLSESLLEVKILPQDKITPGGLFQCVLPVGSAYRLLEKPLCSENKNNITWLAEVPESKQMIAGASKGPSKELLESMESMAFWNSAKKLVSMLANDDTPIWIARCQLKDLEEDLINDYLEKFVNLIKKGCELKKGDEFFAYYPFSTIFYNLDENLVDGILLSPLHPLRLGWLYSAEQAVRNNDAGSVNPIIQMLEGWNFPWVGPAPGFLDHQAIMAAVALEPGPEQLFLGWGCLARFDNPQGSKTKVPDRVASHLVPGGSGTGLNEGGVGAALWDFLRIYPHLPGLTVDLYSASRNSRSTELDKGILRELGGISGRGRGVELPGGLRVFDSYKREGIPPTRDDALKEFSGLSQNGSFRFSWEKYNDDIGKSSDIRFIEDVSIKLSSKTIEGQSLGSIPSLPIRRFAPRERNSLGEITICTGIELGHGNGWESFEKALQSFESPNGKWRKLEIKYSPELLDSQGDAKWVVTGNIFLDPSSLSNMISQSDNRMLWEWRPAYFPKGNTGTDTPRFERRPYTTVAEIPKHFKESLIHTLSLNEDRVNMVFTELGQRGIGLNSLFAMGGNHILGALGFYFSFKLIPWVLGESEFRAIVPVDPIDGFITATLGKNTTEETQRADLLIFDFSISSSGEVNITIIPVEVTSRDYRGDPGEFPNVSSDAVKSKLKQLKNSRTTLEKLVDIYHTRQDPVVFAAISVILESGFLISNQNYNPRSIHKIYCAVNSGKANIQIGRGIMFWFQPTKNEFEDFKKDVSDDGAICCFIDPCRNEHENIFWE